MNFDPQKFTSAILVCFSLLFSLPNSCLADGQWGGKDSLNNSRYKGMLTFLMEYLEVKYPEQSFHEFVYIAAKRQKMFLISDRKISEVYTISTAKKGLGSNIGSNQTPTGLHRVAEMVGDDLPERAIIRAKQFTGTLADIETEAIPTPYDYLTSRALHLEGLESGVNKGGGKDSYQRAIFIHGTHEEGLLGKPASKGCVRMGNKEVIDLFEKVQEGTLVVILGN